MLAHGTLLTRPAVIPYTYMFYFCISHCFFPKSKYSWIISYLGISAERSCMILKLTSNIISFVKPGFLLMMEKVVWINCSCFHRLKKCKTSIIFVASVLWGNSIYLLDVSMILAQVLHEFCINTSALIVKTVVHGRSLIILQNDLKTHRK